MLISSKIALLCGVLVVAAPACALLVGDFEPAVTGGTGGAGGATSSSGVVTSNVTVGAGGMTTGPGSVTSGPSSGSGGSSSTGASASAGSGGADPTSTAAATTSAASTTASSTTGGGNCLDPKSDCNPPPVCNMAVCLNGVCSTAPLDVGAVVPGDPKGNCKKSICDGVGNVAVVNDDTDTPAPTNDCYTGICQMGAPKQAPKTINSGCASNGGSYCDGAGTCVECNITLQCGGPACVNHLCNGPTCNDMMQNGDETDQDCGGSCKKCNFGQMCLNNFDCNSNFCSAGTCG